MQELRSTDILDKEILSESRKKAEKILKNADADCKELLDSLDSEIQKARAEKQKFYDEKLKLFEKNKKVSIPLEKQRFKITFIENAELSGKALPFVGLAEGICLWGMLVAVLILFI